MHQQTWQIAAGDRGRDYSWLFLKHDLMFLGPGRYGPFEAKGYRRVVDRGEFTGRMIGGVRRFSHEVRPGDVVLLREGSRATAIGLVAEDEHGSGYRHDETFADVYGWDLQHTRRVCWQEGLSAELKAIQAKGNGFFASQRQVATFTRVKVSSVLKSINPLAKRCQYRALKVRPEPIPAELTCEQLGQALFFKGLPNHAVDSVLRAIERQRRLLAWYGDQGGESLRPDEHEVVAHLVLPLLLALGWSEQLLAVEWRNVDLAAFWGTPTTAERCIMVCEAKKMGHGLQDVWQQALGYVNRLHLDACRKILLTQGGRFYLYEKPKDGWLQEHPCPTGYVNIEHIRENHIAPPNTSAVETLIALTPAGAQLSSGG